MIPDHALFLIVIALLSVHIQFCASSSQCPIDLNYVLTLPWDSSSCQNSTINNSNTTSNCCQTLTSLYGIGFAQYLKKTSLFRLPDLQTSVSCLSDFREKLVHLNLSPNLASLCFQPQNFVNTTNVCAGIKTRHDWLMTLGNSTPLDTACRGDLTDLTACDSCVLGGFWAQSRLMAFDDDISHSKGCFYYTILYAAGIVNDFGPESDGTASCIFGLPLSLQESDEEWAVVFGPVAAGLAVLALSFIIGFWLKWRFWTEEQQLSRALLGSGSEDYDGLVNWRPEAELRWFKNQELERATNKFSDKNVIGRGQFGVVYKGKLPDGEMIAVKKIVDSDFQGDAEFCQEVEIIATLKHRNLVPLRGYCVGEEHKYLVYDYMPSGNLDDHLYPYLQKGRFKIEKKPMSWPQRKSVILDVANALAYLHHGVKPPIYHRDIKPTNILLDSCMRARVADFGLVKQGKEGESNLTTRVAGTHGYLAPEYALYGQLTEKSDVYSFGIVVLEIMCGRKAIDLTSPPFLITDWAWSLMKDGKLEQVLDPSLLNYEDAVLDQRYPRMIMERFVVVGILCSHLMVALRPNIVDALKMLEGDIEVPSVPDRPLIANNNTRISRVGR